MTKIFIIHYHLIRFYLSQVINSHKWLKIVECWTSILVFTTTSQFNKISDNTGTKWVKKFRNRPSNIRGGQLLKIISGHRTAILLKMSLPQVFFKHFACKMQLRGFYISETLVGNGLICLYSLHIRSKIWRQSLQYYYYMHSPSLIAAEHLWKIGSSRNVF